MRLESCQKTRHNALNKNERVTGFEPVSATWQAAVLPLNYTRISIANNSRHARILILNSVLEKYRLQMPCFDFRLVLLLLLCSSCTLINWFFGISSSFDQ